MMGGFRPFRALTHCFLKSLKYNWLTDSGRSAASVGLDLSAAYDTVALQTTGVFLDALWALLRLRSYLPDKNFILALLMLCDSQNLSSVESVRVLTLYLLPLDPFLESMTVLI